MERFAYDLLRCLAYVLNVFAGVDVTQIPSQMEIDNTSTSSPLGNQWICIFKNWGELGTAGDSFQNSLSSLSQMLFCFVFEGLKQRRNVTGKQRLVAPKATVHSFTLSDTGLDQR